MVTLSIVVTYLYIRDGGDTRLGLRLTRPTASTARGDDRSLSHQTILKKRSRFKTLKSRSENFTKLKIASKDRLWTFYPLSSILVKSTKGGINARPHNRSNTRLPRW
jgi:hypothetical protein